jgi:hypothetical protein
MVTMSQKSSLLQVARTVSRALTPDTHSPTFHTVCKTLANPNIGAGCIRLGTHSNPCDHYGCEGETRKIVLRIAVISGCDASPVLELAEHSFDEISAFAGRAVQRIARAA